MSFPLLTRKALKYISVMFFVAVFLPLDTVFAVITTYESFIVKDPYKVEISSENPGAQFGASFGKGDFNNDGIDDLVVGSPFSSTGLSEWNGSIAIIYGQKVFGEKNLNLSVTPPNIMIFGDRSGDQFGTSIEVGDYNNDGFDDLAVSAPNAYENGTRPGKVYLFYGGRHSLLKNDTSIDLSIQNPDTTFTGYGSGDSFGLALKTLDINNDKIDDLLIGAPYTEAYNIADCGAVYGFLGMNHSEFSSLIRLHKTTANVTFYGQKSNERFGSSVGGGQFFGYKINDVAIGAYSADVDNIKEAGKVYLYKGGSGFASVIRNPVLSINGSKTKEWFGFAIDSGDLNKDDSDDLVITSFPYSSENDGKVFVFLGGEKFLQPSPFINSYESKDIVVENPKNDSFLGSSLELSDMNNDGLDDILVGAPGIGKPLSKSPGDVYFVYSAADRFSSQYDISESRITSQVHGENIDDWFGYSIKTLDFNADGRQDLAIGSRYSDTSLGANSGKVFVLLNPGVPFGDPKEIPEPEDRLVTRGEFVKNIFDKFNLFETKKDYLNDCEKHLEFCLFSFSAISSFNGINLSSNPILYPDVDPFDKYYKYINAGTMLGFLNGFSTEKDSPFHPELPISRIQALKIMLSAADLVPPKYKFELVAILGSLQKVREQISYFKDIDALISYMWWYPRYANFAYEKGLIDDSPYFRPDENITAGELNDMLNRTIEFIENRSNEEVTI